MIFGTGVDLCEISRIAQVFARQPRLAQKILTPAEYTTFIERHTRSADRGVRYLATRFCAKEALSKALGLGMREPMHWQHCQIEHQPLGQPVFVFHEPLQSWLAERSLRVHLSLSDEVHYATAFVVIEHT